MNFHGNLVANQVTVVTLDQGYPHLEVLNRNGSAEIYFTTDGTTPTLGGSNSDVLPAVIGSVVVDVANPDSPSVVQLVSAGAPSFSVKGVLSARF